MGEIKATFGGKNATGHEDGMIHQNPDGSYSCCCDYEIKKVDENTWKCEGGGHTYRMDEGDMVMDKFGNMMMKKKGEQK